MLDISWNLLNTILSMKNNDCVGTESFYRLFTLMSMWLNEPCGCCQCPASGESVHCLPPAQEKIEFRRRFPLSAYCFHTAVKTEKSIDPSDSWGLCVYLIFARQNLADGHKFSSVQFSRSVMSDSL